MSTASITHTQSLYDAFLSFNSKHRDSARAVAAGLRERGIAVWVDEDSMSPGDFVADALATGLRGTGAFVVLIGPDPLGPWQRTEMRAALHECVERGKRLIPVFLPGVTGFPDEVSLYFLRILSALQLPSLDDGSQLDRLVEAIHNRDPASRRPEEVNPSPILFYSGTNNTTIVVRRLGTKSLYKVPAGLERSAAQRPAAADKNGAFLWKQVHQSAERIYSSYREIHLDLVQCRLLSDDQLRVICSRELASYTRRLRLEYQKLEAVQPVISEPNLLAEFLKLRHCHAPLQSSLTYHYASYPCRAAVHLLDRLSALAIALLRIADDALQEYLR